MQRVTVAKLRPGMTVARNIYGADGSLLLAEGIVLTSRYINRLYEQKINSVYIQNPFIDDIDIPEVIKEETRVKAVSRVAKCFKKYALSRELDAKGLTQIADAIVAEVVRNRHAMVHLTDIRTYDDYTFSHSVNVCVLAVLIGTSMNYNQTQLKELALGALLHDLGKTGVPKEILNKPGSFSDEEMEIMKEHPELGFDVLRQRHEISLVAAHIALDHHERYDGTGYPRGIAKDEIHEYARIVAIADVYDALTSDRPYRDAIPPHKAYEILLNMSGSHLDANILAVFVKHISIYPIGCIVRLSSGELGVVAAVPPGIPWRPSVRIIADGKGVNCSGEGRVVELVKNTAVTIEYVLHEEEMVELFSEELVKKIKKTVVECTG